MTTRRLTLIATLAAGVALLLGGPAAAHTVPDVAAVPAGSQATVALQPGHGCGDSPTVAVSIRAPMRGATAWEVPGWTATATEDEDGTVLDWTGGVLPADETGRFPVTFSAPDTPGQLLTFPAVQVCENGEELAWISGDPAAELPAPRVLVLPPDAAPAASIDEVPPDAPGREQLTEIVDVDDPSGSGAEAAGAGGGEGPTPPTTTAPAAGSGAEGDGGAAGADAPPDGGDADAADPVEAAADTGDDDGSGVAVIAAVIVVAVLAAVVAAVLLRRRSPRPR